jgi:3-methyladenine DNA glycosylase AlkD
MTQFDMSEVKKITSDIETTIQALTVHNTPMMRSVRRKYSQSLKRADPEFILQLARELVKKNGPYRWIAYEMIMKHPPTFQRLGANELEELGQGINSWWSVDDFARLLAGPAWLRGQFSDQVIHGWARSSDPWWRRAAVVSTVALNVRSHGGTGDPTRTLKVCQMVVKDREDMVVKALSWALRELIVHDSEAVEEFLVQNDSVLAARVKREVMNKLKTGLKNPRRTIK